MPAISDPANTASIAGKAKLSRSGICTWGKELGEEVSVRRSILLSLLQRYLSLGISFLGTMVVSRLISPEEFGIFFVAAGMLMIAGTISQLGIGVYLVQEKALTRELTGTAFALLLLSSATMALMIFILRHEIAGLFGNTGVADVLGVTALVLLVAPLSTPCFSLLQRRMRFDLVLRIGVGGSIIQAATAVVLAMFGFSYMSMAWAVLAEQVAIMILSLAIAPRDIWVRPTLVEWRRVMNVGGPIALSSLLTQIGTAAPQIALGRWAGFEAVGLFTRGMSLFDLFNRGFLQGVTPVLLPALANIDRSGESLVKPVILTYAHLGAIAWPFFALLALLAQPVIRVLFGPQWDQSVPILQILCLIGLSVPITAFISDVLFALGRGRLWLAMQTCTQTFRITLIVFAAMLSVHAVAWALVISQMLSLTLALLALNHVVGLRLHDLQSPTVKNVAVMLAAVTGPFAIAAVAGEHLTALALLFIVGPTALLGWVAGLYLTGHLLWAEGSKAMLKSSMIGRFRRSTSQ